jgi:hypothetical protein
MVSFGYRWRLFTGEATEPCDKELLEALGPEDPSSLMLEAALREFEENKKMIAELERQLIEVSLARNLRRPPNTPYSSKAEKRVAKIARRAMRWPPRYLNALPEHV